MPDIAFVNQWTKDEENQNQANYIYNDLPAVQAGDLIFFWARSGAAFAQNAGVSSLHPQGATLVSGYPYNIFYFSNPFGTWLWSKVADGTEGTGVTIQTTAGVWSFGRIVFRNVKSWSSRALTRTTEASSQPTFTYPVPEIPNVKPHSTLMLFHACYNNLQFSGGGLTGWTKRIGVNGVYGQGFDVWTQDFPSGGTVGPYVADVAQNGYGAHLLDVIELEGSSSSGKRMIIGG
jgi:hypothetical protein